MPTPETAVDATTSSATPFEQDLGELFGDYSSSGEAPEPEDEAEGTTPSAAPDGTETDAESAPASPDAAGQESEGETPAAQPEADDDPFKDTTPAEYVVGGQHIPVEDIRVFKEGGAVIRPESLPNILSKLAERDTLAEQSRSVKQQYDTLAKINEWTQGDQTISGPQAAIERIAAHAAVLAENELIVQEVLNCPDLYAAGFLTTELRPDGKGGQYEAVVFRPDAIKALQTQNELRQIKATQAIRDHYGKLVADSSRPAPAPINYEQATPELIQMLATQAKLDASVLTPGDRAMLAKQLPAHIKDGLASVAWQELVKERIQLRTEQKTQASKLVTTTQDATRKGLANMAAAARGVKPTGTKPVAQKPVSPVTERHQNEGDLYDQMERAAAAAMRSAR